MVSALDGMVEELVPALREFLLDYHASQVVSGAVDAGVISVPTDEYDTAVEAVRNVLKSNVPKLERPRGKGAARYEDALRQVGLAAPSTRPIPPDLDEALTEIGVLRDVLVHRAGRIDDRGPVAGPDPAISVRRRRVHPPQSRGLPTLFGSDPLLRSRCFTSGRAWAVERHRQRRGPHDLAAVVSRQCVGHGRAWGGNQHRYSPPAVRRDGALARARGLGVRRRFRPR